LHHLPSQYLSPLPSLHSPPSGAGGVASRSARPPPAPSPVRGGAGRGRARGAAVKSLAAPPPAQSAEGGRHGAGGGSARRAAAMLENGSLRNCCDPGGRGRFGSAEREEEAAGSPRPAWVVSTLSSVLIFTTVVDILGNLLVIVSVFKNRKLRNSE
uniref:Melatonin receptor 1B n=1 Tax=Cairina moschata TaxID=8855 RepID=A0A8C3C3N5_CAIMO